MKRWPFWARIWRRAALEQELRDELEFHRLERTDDLIRQGHTATEAARLARIELGMLETHKDRVRQAYGLNAPDQLLICLRSSWNNLRRHQVLCWSAILILSFAVAANVAMYAMFETYQSAAPSWIREGRMVELNLRQVNGTRAASLSDAEFEILQDAFAKSADHVIRYKPMRMQPNHRSDGRQSTAYGVAVNATYFQSLAAPSMGRVIAAYDEANDAMPVIVLSHEGWQQLAGGRADVLGQSVTFGATSFTVVGVMPEGFVDFQPFPSHFWISNAGYARWREKFRGTDLTFANDIALVGVRDLVRARGELLARINRLPDRAGDATLASVDLVQRTSLFSNSDQKDVQAAAWPVLALVILVLVVACANLGNLMLAKALGQQQELAVRASIGASRRRLVLQLCLDATIIAVAAALLGLLLSHLIVNPLHAYLLSIMAETGLRPIAVQLTLKSGGFAFLLCWFASLLFGLLPALSVTSKHLHQQSKRDGAAFGTQIAPSKLRSSLTILQIAASFTLLALASTVALLAAKQQGNPLGFQTDGVIDLRHPEPSSKLRDQIDALPGVIGSTATLLTPLYGAMPRAEVMVDQRNMMLGYKAIDQRYLDLLGIRLLQGRNFSGAQADSASPVALVSAATAQKLWPDQNALGRTIELVLEQGQRRRLSVIGVVSDVVSGMIFNGIDQTAIYLPTALGSAQDANQIGTPNELMITTRAGSTKELIKQIQLLCLAQAAPQPCDPWPMQQVIERQELMFVIARNACAALALCALMITLVGLFGVVRFNVANRTHEIGVRMAIGASHHSMISMLLRDLLRQLRWGIVLGLPISLLASYGLHRIFGMDWLALFSCTLLGAVGLGCAAYLVAWWPARAVRHISPKVALS